MTCGQSLSTGSLHRTFTVDTRISKSFRRTWCLSRAVVRNLGVARNLSGSKWTACGSVWQSTTKRQRRSSLGLFQRAAVPRDPMRGEDSKPPSNCRGHLHHRGAVRDPAHSPQPSDSPTAGDCLSPNCEYETLSTDQRERRGTESGVAFETRNQWQNSIHRRRLLQDPQEVP